MPAWPALLFLTHRLAFLVILGWRILFLSFFIFGSEKEDDLEVASGVWKYGLPCLFHSIWGSCCRCSHLGDFKSLSIMRPLRSPNHQASTSPMTWWLVLIIIWGCDRRCRKNRNQSGALKGGGWGREHQGSLWRAVSLSHVEGCGTNRSFGSTSYGEEVTIGHCLLLLGCLTAWTAPATTHFMIYRLAGGLFWTY